MSLTALPGLRRPRRLPNGYLADVDSGMTRDDGQLARRKGVDRDDGSSCCLPPERSGRISRQRVRRSCDGDERGRTTDSDDRPPDETIP